ncbi:MAG: 4a-hydroxytetrahydrobiopterin dehydratase [Chloroflexi bacterium OHK40]
MAKLSEAEITERLEQLSGWARNGEMITKTYKLPSFPAAVSFVTHVAFLAEAAGHHPDIDIRYNRVTLALTTHDAGGLTAKDFALAEQADEVMG